MSIWCYNWFWIDSSHPKIDSSWSHNWFWADRSDHIVDFCWHFSKSRLILHFITSPQVWFWSQVYPTSCACCIFPESVVKLFWSQLWALSVSYCTSSAHQCQNPINYVDERSLERASIVFCHQNPACLWSYSIEELNRQSRLDHYLKLGFSKNASLVADLLQMSVSECQIPDLKCLSNIVPGFPNKTLCWFAAGSLKQEFVEIIKLVKK